MTSLNNALNKTKLMVHNRASTLLTMICIILASLGTANATMHHNNTSSHTNTSSHANSTDSNNDRNDIGYIGLKTGMLSIASDEHASSIDDSLQFGGFVGYKLGEFFGVEVDYSVTTDADISSKYNDSGQYKVANYGMYMTYNYPFSEGFYAKSKIGVTGAEIDETYFSTDEAVENITMKVSSDDVGLGGGIGIGYDLGYDLSLEGELNFLRSDNIDTNALIVAIKYNF